MERVGKIKREPVPTLFFEKEDCCGCTACYAACNKNAITLIKDQEGFFYPEIDEQKCVGCKLCVKVCPVKMAHSLLDK